MVRGAFRDNRQMYKVRQKPNPKVQDEHELKKSETITTQQTDDLRMPNLMVEIG